MYTAMDASRNCTAPWAALLTVLFLLAAALQPAPAAAQPAGQKLPVFEGVGINQQLGDTVRTDLTFRNEAGEAVTLGQYFNSGKPVLLELAYFSCPMLCPLMLDGLTGTLQGLAWTPGQEYEVLTVSFDPRDTPETAQQKKDQYVQKLGKAGAAGGWHFLTGAPDAIEALTESVGFDYRWVESKQEFAHPTALVFLSGEGKITRYIYGMEIPPDDARKALVEASDGEVGSTLDRIALYCFQFDPNENSYVADAFNIMRLGGLLTVLVLGGVLFFFWKRERQDLDEAAGGKAERAAPEG